MCQGFSNFSGFFPDSSIRVKTLILFVGASTKLLPPSSFEAPKGEDPWKALAKATNQIMELRMQNEKLV